MFSYEKDGKINGIVQEENSLYYTLTIAAFSAEKKDFQKQLLKRRIAGIIAILLVAVTLLLMYTIVKGSSLMMVYLLAVTAVACLFLGVHHLVSDLLSKTSLCYKYTLKGEPYDVDNGSDPLKVRVYSEIFAKHGKIVFWKRYPEMNDADLLTESAEIMIQEKALRDSIKGMENYLESTSENTIRDEVFRKLDDAKNKLITLIERFNKLQEDVLRLSDSDRDREVLEFMESIDHINTKTA